MLHNSMMATEDALLREFTDTPYGEIKHTEYFKQQLGSFKSIDLKSKEKLSFKNTTGKKLSFKNEQLVE
jgi:hypothetical protein